MSSATRERRLAVAALVLGNAVAVAGVPLEWWGLGTLFLLYWIETGVVGVFGTLRTAAAGRRAELADDVHLPGGRWLDAPGETRLGGLALYHRNGPFVLYLVAFYGLAWAAFGLVVLVLVPVANQLSGTAPVPLDRTVLVGVAAVSVGHLVEFGVDYASGAVAERSPRDGVRTVRPRIVGLGLVVVVTFWALWATVWLGPLVALATLLAVKVLVDAWTSVAERSALESSLDGREDSFVDLVRLVAADVWNAVADAVSGGAEPSTPADAAVGPLDAAPPESGRRSGGRGELIASTSPDLRAHVASLFVDGVARALFLTVFFGSLAAVGAALLGGPTLGAIAFGVAVAAAVLNEVGTRIRATALSYRFYDDRVAVYNHATGLEELAVPYDEVASISVRYGAVGRRFDAGLLWIDREGSSKVTLWAMPRPSAVRTELLELAE